MREANEGWAAYVGALVRARYGGNSSALAKALDVSTSTVTRWIDGATPEIPRLKQLSRVTDIPMVELLVAAGALETEADVDLVGTIPEQAAVDVTEAIRGDPDLIDDARIHLIHQYELLKRLPAEGPSVARSRKHRRTATAAGATDTGLRAVARGGRPEDRAEVRRLARQAREQHDNDESGGKQ